jgi:putative ABC transport system substrate-binding protein
MISKLLELIETVSGAKRIAVLYDPTNLGKQLDVGMLQESGRASGITIDPVGIHSADAVDTAFAAMAKVPPGALIVLVDGITLGNKERIVRAAARLHLPAIYQERTFVESGGLMSYALNYCQHFQRAAAYVDKILKGQRPASLPIEQPATFQFVVNLKAARILGLNLPPPILAFADDVIE